MESKVLSSVHISRRREINSRYCYCVILYFPYTPRKGCPSQSRHLSLTSYTRAAASHVLLIFQRTSAISPAFEVCNLSGIFLPDVLYRYNCANMIFSYKITRLSIRRARTSIYAKRARIFVITRIILSKRLRTSEMHYPWQK